MCGFLIYPFKVKAGIVERHLERQKHRGVDGYGALSLKEDGLRINRSTRSMIRQGFLESYSKIIPRSGVVIHHRKASVGGIKAELVHPLRDSENTLYIMQNGTKRILAELTGAASDTLGLAEIWQEVSDYLIWQVLDKTGVVFVWDQGRLFFHRDKSRTLFKCVDGVASGMYASEPMEPGMWALIDEYILEELPMNVSEWNLSHGDPEEFVEGECIRHYCKSKFVGVHNQNLCPQCSINTTRYQQSTTTRGVHNA